MDNRTFWRKKMHLFSKKKKKNCKQNLRSREKNTSGAEIPSGIETVVLENKGVAERFNNFSVNFAQ